MTYFPPTQASAFHDIHAAMRTLLATVKGDSSDLKLHDAVIQAHRAMIDADIVVRRALRDQEDAERFDAAQKREIVA